MSACPSQERLQRLVDEQLPSSENDSIAHHIESCSACRKRLDKLSRSAITLGGMDVAVDKTENPDFQIHLQFAPPLRTRASTLSETLSGHESYPDVPGYEILGEIGRGGMGVVYRARQIGLNRLVALKMILVGPHAGAEVVARFRREATAVARLRHPNVVQIHEIGEQKGRPFYSMEYVSGGNLSQTLSGNPQNPRLSAELVQTLARAIHVAHAQGIIHRDLKPANVLLQTEHSRSAMADPEATVQSLIGNSPFGIPKITDFGLAKVSAEDAASFHTISGAVMGSPSYMAPEQAQGNVKAIGPPTDIYALGTVLYEMLTGRPPFRAATPAETVFMVLHQEPVSPRRLQPGVPRDLETICLTCLQKDLRRRYDSAKALADDLRRWVACEPIHARPTSAWRRGVKWARRRPALAALAALCFVTAAVLIAGALWHDARLQNEVTRTRQQQARSVDNLQTAIDILETQHGEFRRAAYYGYSQADPIIQNLLPTAVEFYDRLLVNQDIADPHVRRAIGRAHFGLGTVHRMRNSMDNAVRYYQRALDAQELLLTEFPDNDRLRIDLALTIWNYSVLLNGLKRPKEAAALRDMYSLIQHLSPDEPRLGEVAVFVAQRLFGEGKMREALPWLNRHITEIEALHAKAQPGRTLMKIRNVLNSMYVTRAMLLVELGEDQKAIAAWSRAIDLGEVENAAYRVWFCRLQRGLANYRIGEYQTAIRDVATAFKLSLEQNKAREGARPSTLDNTRDAPPLSLRR